MRRASKKIIFGLLGLFISANICFADNVSTAIESYKAGNYNDCIATMKTVVKNDPTSAIGYYYLGLAYSKTGKSFLAVQNYDKVIALNSDDTLTALAKQGRSKAGGKNVVSMENQIEDIEDEYNPIYNDAAVGTQSNSAGSNNAQQSAKPAKPAATVKTPQQKQTAQTNPNGTPSNEEILKAINTLRKAGLLNNGGAALTGAPNAQNPANVSADTRAQEMQALMMMMNNNNGYGGNNMNMMQMMPYLNNGGKVDPKLMQMMLMNQMMPNFSTGNENNGY